MGREIHQCSWKVDGMIILITTVTQVLGTSLMNLLVAQAGVDVADVAGFLVADAAYQSKRIQIIFIASTKIMAKVNIMKTAKISCINRVGMVTWVDTPMQKLCFGKKGIT